MRPQAYIFQAEFVETDKQYRYIDGQPLELPPGCYLCYALGFRTIINKSENILHDTWEDAKAAALKSWSQTRKQAKDKLDAVDKALDSIIMLERPNG